MGKSVLPALMLFSVMSANAQTVTAVPKKSQTKKPACSPGAICFSGKISEGEEFRKTLTSELEFVLRPGWTITIVPRRTVSDCQEFADVVNSPYHEHKDLFIDTSWGHSAEQEVSDSPREFRFVTNCADYQVESDRLLIVLGAVAATPQKYDEALAKLGTSAKGRGRFWITEWKISHAGDTPEDKLGVIQQMTFSVEILLLGP